jgi:hypothetical protein
VETQTLRMKMNCADAVLKHLSTPLVLAEAQKQAQTQNRPAPQKIVVWEFAAVVPPDGMTLELDERFYEFEFSVTR